MNSASGSSLCCFPTYLSHMSLLFFQVFPGIWYRPYLYWPGCTVLSSPLASHLYRLSRQSFCLTVGAVLYIMPVCRAIILPAPPASAFDKSCLPIPLACPQDISCLPVSLACRSCIRNLPYFAFLSHCSSCLFHWHVLPSSSTDMF